MPRSRAEQPLSIDDSPSFTTWPCAVAGAGWGSTFAICGAAAVVIGGAGRKGSGAGGTRPKDTPSPSGFGIGADCATGMVGSPKDRPKSAPVGAIGDGIGMGVGSVGTAAGGAAAAAGGVAGSGVPTSAAIRAKGLTIPSLATGAAGMKFCGAAAATGTAGSWGAASGAAGSVGSTCRGGNTVPVVPFGENGCAGGCDAGADADAGGTSHGMGAGVPADGAAVPWVPEVGGSENGVPANPCVGAV